MWWLLGLGIYGFSTFSNAHHIAMTHRLKPVCLGINQPNKNMSSPIKTKLNPMLVALLVSLGFALTPLAVQAQIPAVRLQAANYNATSGRILSVPTRKPRGRFPLYPPA
jgi:hypothetical protein